MVDLASGANNPRKSFVGHKARRLPLPKKSPRIGRCSLSVARGLMNVRQFMLRLRSVSKAPSCG
jgi:hypothetical protein